MILSLFLFTIIFCLSKLNIYSSSHNCPIDIRLEWRLGNISACFAWIDNFFSGIWVWCVYGIVYELERFTFIGFSDGSLVCTVVVSASR